jgi:hypothetical protein
MGLMLKPRQRLPRQAEIETAVVTPPVVPAVQLLLVEETKANEVRKVSMVHQVRLVNQVSQAEPVAKVYQVIKAQSVIQVKL